MAIFDWEWGRNSAPREGQKIPCLFNSDDFSCLLITFENSFNPDQDSQNGSQSVDAQIVLILNFSEKLILKKVSRRQQMHEELPSMQRVKGVFKCDRDNTVHAVDRA